MEKGRISVERDRAADVLDRVRMAACLMLDQSQKMPGGCMVRVGLQDGTVDSFGFLQPPRLVLAKSLVKRVPDRRHADIIGRALSLLKQAVS